MQKGRENAGVTMRTWQRSPRFLFLWTDDAPDAGFPQAGDKRRRTVSLPENE
jgi:hypothetical protein